MWITTCSGLPFAVADVNAHVFITIGAFVITIRLTDDKNISEKNNKINADSFIATHLQSFVGTCVDSSFRIIISCVFAFHSLTLVLLFVYN